MADSTTFQPGDIVQLKSGGVLMTVQIQDNDGDVWVYLSDENGFPQPRQSSIPAIVLKKADQEASNKTADEGK